MNHTQSSQSAQRIRQPCCLCVLYFVTHSFVTCHVLRVPLLCFGPSVQRVRWEWWEMAGYFRCRLASSASSSLWSIYQKWAVAEIIGSVIPLRMLMSYRKSSQSTQQIASGQGQDQDSSAHKNTILTNPPPTPSSYPFSTSHLTLPPTIV